jgi:ATP-dependent DNA ligase
VKDPPVDLRPPQPAMTARTATELPDPRHSDSYTFEPKLDGWRCLAFHPIDGQTVLQSRQQRPLTCGCRERCHSL